MPGTQTYQKAAKHNLNTDAHKTILILLTTSFCLIIYFLARRMSVV